MSAARDSIHDAWDGLRARPARAALTAGTMALGLATLAALLSALAGLQRQANRIVAEFGADAIALLPAAAAPLPPQARARLRDNLPGVTVSAARLYRALPLAPSLTADLWAGDADLPHARAWPLLAGRSLDPDDVRRARRVCLISRALSDDLRRGVRDTIDILGASFTVVGIVSPSGRARDLDARLAPGDRFLFVPRSVRPDWLRDAQPPPPGDDVIFLKTGRPETVADVLATARRLLAPPDTLGAAGGTWVTPTQVRAGVRRLRTALSWSGGAIAGLCLLLSGVSLAGLMFSRVQERVPEIGLRRALGAAPADIAGLFLAESLLIGAAAATLGLAAWLLALLNLPAAALPISMPMTPVAFAAPLGLALLTAVLSAAGPALRAARLPPHSALRND